MAHKPRSFVSLNLDNPDDARRTALIALALFLGEKDRVGFALLDPKRMTLGKYRSGDELIFSQLGCGQNGIAAQLAAEILTESGLNGKRPATGLALDLPHFDKFTITHTDGCVRQQAERRIAA